jgi:16S rRNA (guanine527-N7)-methyltransferase
MVPMRDLANATQALLGIHITPAQLAALEAYETALLDWNSRFNLTAIDDPGKVRVKHFLDSLTCLLVMRDTPMERIVDVGSGAGFPGLPLKIVCPAIKLTLVESVGKKADFCCQVVKVLGLEGVDIIQERAERLGRDLDYREQYDWALARAVAKLPVLVEYLLPLVKVGGSALAMKGESAPAEAHAADNGITLLGGHLRQLVPITLPGVVDERYLVVVDKIAATPETYPRRVGVPAKRPL